MGRGLRRWGPHLGSQKPGGVEELVKGKAGRDRRRKKLSLGSIASKPRRVSRGMGVVLLLADELWKP